MTDAEHKQFATLAAQYALAGHALMRSRDNDKAAPFYALRWGWIRPLENLDAARRFLEQIKEGR